MPRKPIKIRPRVEYLSILNAKGEVDEALDPKLDADKAIYLYRLMLTARRLDEKCINMQRQGRIGTYGPCHGQEACHCPAALVMEKEDWVVHAYREPGSFFHRGWPLETVIQFWGGYEAGCSPPKGVNDTPITVPIATQTLHAMGIGWAMKLRGDNHAVLCYCGDGGTSEGDFHEALNFAGTFQLPVVFLVVNNHWAISYPREKQTGSETLAQKALAYGFDGLQLDGNDALAVYVGAKEAVEKAKTGGGPTLIEAVTYRLNVHTTADDPTKYRSKEEVDRWTKLEPLPRFQTYLKHRGYADQAALEEMDAEIKKEIEAAVERYEAGRDVDPLDCFAHLYETLPAELTEQREEFKAALEREGLAKKS